MAKQKKKRPNLLIRMLDALLTLIDWICESIAGAAMGLLGLIWRLVRGLLLAAFAMAAWICRALFSIPMWIVRRLGAKRNAAHRCLRLDGPEFEAYVALVLRDNGFRNVEITKGSGDQGADILADRNGKSYAIQCKNYEGTVGNFAVQEAYAGAQFYGCDCAAVICPGEFTRGAKELARATGVLLWDGRKLSRMMRVSGRRPKHRA